MTLTWKDLVTTVLVILTAAFSYLVATGYKFPFISGFRSATLVLLILGIGMCASSAGGSGANNPFIMIASTLGVVALILIIAGFIFGTKTIFLLTAGTIILLWIIATTRHLIGAR